MYAVLAGLICTSNK